MKRFDHFICNSPGKKFGASHQLARQAKVEFEKVAIKREASQAMQN
jgi:hypothetical protein